MSGSNLEANIAVTAPTGFEVSSDDIAFSGTLEISHADGSASATVYARLTGNSEGVFDGDIMHASAGATTQEATVSGVVSGLDPMIQVSVSSLDPFTTEVGEPSDSQSYTVSGSNLTADITVTAPDGFEVSLDDDVFSGSVMVSESDGSASATVYARLTGVTAGAPSGDITHESSGATTENVAVSGTVTEPGDEPTLIAYWNFNDAAEEGNPWPAPIFADAGSGSISYTFDEDGVKDFAGSTLNALFGDSAGGSFSVEGHTDMVNNGEHFDIVLSTVGYEQVNLSFAARGTGTGFGNNQVSYSLNGLDFVDLGDPFDPRDGSAFNIFQFAFGSALNDASTAIIRVTLDGATGTSGNNRYDNIQVTGILTGEPPPPGPMISLSGIPLSAFATTTGSPSASQSYSVMGSNLEGDITVTAPSGFEVSLNDSDFSGSVMVSESEGSASGTVHARLTGASAGSFSGNITHASSGATTQNAAVTGEVTDPDPTEPVTEAIPGPGSYTFPGTGVSMEFSTVPAGGGEVTVEVVSGTPSPAPPGDPADVYLNITSDMANYSFAAVVTLDVSGIAGFDADTKVAYYNATTEAWVLIGGSYDAVEETFSFATNHFTPFAFVNLETEPFAIYVSDAPGAASAGVVFPNESWATTPYDPNDWRFDDVEIVFYVIPEEGTEFGFVSLTVGWDESVLAFEGVSSDGGLFDESSAFFNHTLGSPNSVQIDAARLDNENFLITDVAGGNQYIAALTFSLVRPGASHVDLTALDFRFNDGMGGQLGVYTAANGADVKAYLGDVASPEDESTGDGSVDIEDLILFTGAYWSGVPGGPDPDLTTYKVKYDVGPTADNTVFSLPLVDAQIQFEDLVIFALSYGLSHIGAYRPGPEGGADILAAAFGKAENGIVEVGVGPAVVQGEELLVPVVLSDVLDLRAIALEYAIDTQAFEVLGAVRPEGGMIAPEMPAFMAAFASKGVGMADAARLGEAGITGADDLVHIRVQPLVGIAGDYAGSTDVLELTSATLRNSINEDIPSMLNAPVSTDGDVMPAVFELEANFPNPFAGSTTIVFALPEASHVRLTVFDALGREVATLADGEFSAGTHHAVLDANGLASGTYLYRIEAGAHVVTRRMTILH